MGEEALVKVKGMLLSKPVLKRIMQEVDCCEFLLEVDEFHCDENSCKSNLSKYIVTEFGNHALVTAKTLDVYSECIVTGKATSEMIEDDGQQQLVHKIQAKAVDYLK